MLVEKRVAGIIRWLERLKKSYSSGALESALMDAECARADLENLRLAVWEKVKPAKPPRPKISLAEYFMKAMKCSLIAAVIVMTAVFPISKDEFIMPGISERAFIAANNTSSYEFVDGKTSQVKSSVNASRLGNSAVVDDEEISQRKHSVVANKVSPAVESKISSAKSSMQSENSSGNLNNKKSAKKSSAQNKRGQANNVKPSKEAASQPAAKTVAYDKVFSLMQTGQRALKNNNSVVNYK